MTEREARRLLARNAGRAICVHYRARSDGTIVTAPEPGPRRLVLATAVLSACAGHLQGDEIEDMDSCANVICDDRFASWSYAPEADEIDFEIASEQVTKPASSDDLSGSSTDSRDDANRPEASSSAAAPDSTIGAPKPRSNDQTVRIDFAIDPDEQRLMVVIVGRPDPWHDENGRLRFAPTRQLLEDLRERWRARSRQRARRRR